MRDTEGCHDDDGDAGDDDDDSSNNDDNRIDDNFHVNDENNTADDDKNWKDDENIPFIEKQGGMKKEPTSTCALITKNYSWLIRNQKKKMMIKKQFVYSYCALWYKFIHLESNDDDLGNVSHHDNNENFDNF